VSVRWPVSTVLHAISAWVDAANSGRDCEALLWHRCAKVNEEGGEVIEALIAYTGGNPRKPSDPTPARIEKELLDTAAAALAAVAHLHGNDTDVDLIALLSAHVEQTAIRAGLLP
jgi:hypothetical protein